VGAPEAVFALNEMSSADQYTHEHSVRVCTLGVLLASRHWRQHGWTDFRGRARFDNIDRLLSQLGFGLLVHDIGKLAIAPEIRDKPGALTLEEWQEMRRHPTLGREMLEGAQMPFVALGVVEGHHERWDGGGYPRGLAGQKIQDFACLAAIADVYDAVCSARPYKPARPPHEGVRVILEGAGTAFHPGMVETFARLVMPFPVGHEVLLPDGGDAVVVDVDPERPWAPTVRRRDGSRVVEETVDLARQAA
jgi:HD-GYP domain-containing protein (c-di-GMP phosphodiesterase class II)